MNSRRCAVAEDALRCSGPIADRVGCPLPLLQADTRTPSPSRARAAPSVTTRPHVHRVLPLARPSPAMDVGNLGIPEHQARLAMSVISRTGCSAVKHLSIARPATSEEEYLPGCSGSNGMGIAQNRSAVSGGCQRGWGSERRAGLPLVGWAAWVWASVHRSRGRPAASPSAGARADPNPRARQGGVKLLGQLCRAQVSA